jgi:hypothetical protein
MTFPVFISCGRIILSVAIFSVHSFSTDAFLSSFPPLRLRTFNVRQQSSQGLRSVFPPFIIPSNIVIAAVPTDKTTNEEWKFMGNNNCTWLSKNFEVITSKSDRSVNENNRVLDMMGLPTLGGSTKYSSGVFKTSQNCSWYQNSHNVFIYFPIQESSTKDDISVTFSVTVVNISVVNQFSKSFRVFDSIIPMGCCWSIEQSNAGDKFILVDLEKRNLLVDWKSLFPTNYSTSEVAAEAEKSKLLERLFAANKGMSKVTGFDPDTIEDMLKNEDLIESISSSQLEDQYNDSDVTGDEESRRGSFDWTQHVGQEDFQRKFEELLKSRAYNLTDSTDKLVEISNCENS